MRKEKLCQAIAEKQAILRELGRKTDVVERELEALERELSALETTQPPREQPSTAEPTTSREKVALFCSLFRGREDVYPTLWTNTKTGRTGYAPACANEWVRGVCEKPRVRCGDCPNQAFTPMTDHVILEHLQGRKVVGIYPMLPEETCWFLAADFDKGDWKADVAAFRKVCDEAGIPVSVERSRSGDGAHAWFFFDAPVPAASARRMGGLLITRAMSRRHELNMVSYDRLFPSQDTMPRGGIGSLIALPLQREARECGDTMFVDESFRAYGNQWAYLAGIRKISPSPWKDWHRVLWGTGVSLACSQAIPTIPSWPHPGHLSHRTGESRHRLSSVARCRSACELSSPSASSLPRKVYRHLC